ncbi:MAG: tRNA dimethylallyltransferase [Oceanicoccus sp.]|jgi:tRNA dimethylallyltransferase
MSLPPAFFLMGPTASGKTELAIQLCAKLPCEIVSVDSALVYRDMDIGTAKPNAEELAAAPHKLISFLDPAETYSTADFRRDALREMKLITARGNIPLLVGGSMLYFKTLLDGIADLPASDLSVRAEIQAVALAKGWPFVHGLLAEVDPTSAARIHPNHSQRIERALSVFRATGKTMTTHYQLQKSQPSTEQHLPYNILQMAIAPLDRKVLHARIERRFKLMLESGFIDEVKLLHRRADLNLDLPSMRSVGYRQAWQYLDGQLTYDEMSSRAVIATRQLAKRQFTWLNKWKELHWVHTDEQGLLVSNSSAADNVSDIVGMPSITLALRYANKFSV